MRSILFGLLVSTTLCVGCDAEEPGVGDKTNPDAAVPLDASVDMGVPLTIEGLPPTSHWDSVPVFGRGPSNGTIIVDSTAGIQSVDTASDGSFCLDVDLLKGVNNTMSIQAIDQAGEKSDTQNFSVMQQGEPPEPGDPTPAKNIALGGLPTAWSTVYEKVGTFAAITDDSISSSVLMKNDVNDDDYLVLRLPTPDSVERIRITSDTTCHLSDYLIHTAKVITVEQQVPFGAMEMNEGPWTFRGHSGQDMEADVNVTDCSTATYSCQEYTFEPTVVNFIGLRFLDSVCSSFLLGERRLRQIEAWTPIGVAPPTISAPTCQGG
ncbi:MAG: hypothetical protein JKY56_06445 [Kofleriaceae bacterium]|nr:hypothetical protein [Kofleriaceae bacterium]